MLHFSAPASIFALRLARYCARAPVSLERMSFDPALEQVTYRSDKADGPTAGTATVDPLEFLARVVTHIPDPGQVMQRYYGWYASRTRGARRRQSPDAAEAPVAIVEPVNWSLRAARVRWAELLRRIFEVDPLACPRCRGLMRIVAVIIDACQPTSQIPHFPTSQIPHRLLRRTEWRGQPCGW